MAATHVLLCLQHQSSCLHTFRATSLGSQFRGTICPRNQYKLTHFPRNQWKGRSQIVFNVYLYLYCHTSITHWHTRLFKIDSREPKFLLLTCYTQKKHPMSPVPISLSSYCLCIAYPSEESIWCVCGKPPPESFSCWCIRQKDKHPQFLYWYTTLELELLMLAFVRSLRIGEFDLNVDTLTKLTPWFFSLNHIIYFPCKRYV